MQRTTVFFMIIVVAINCHLHAQNYLSGYSKTIKGEIINYHAPQPDASRALLIRSEDNSRYLEWKTEKIPLDYKEKTVRFLMLAGIDVNAEKPHKWEMAIDGKKFFTINTPVSTNQKSISWPGKDGATLQFNVQSVDRHGDFMGYLILEVPADDFRGKDLTIRVTGESAKSQTWFMVFEYKTERKIKLVAEPAIMKGAKENYQALRLDMTHYGNPVNATITIGKRKINKLLEFGFNQFYLETPVISKTTTEQVSIHVGKQKIAQESFILKPVETKTIYLIHHSHVDIGYTHVQQEVEELQWSFLESAIELAEKSKDYPEGSRFKWNVEVMWAVDSYLKNAPPEKVKALKNAVKNGWIELAGLYANELTALCSSRELIELTESARRIGREFEVQVESAMITDIPGWTWGIVPVLANSGVKYFSLGTNQGHRIGDIVDKWGDKPFYWVSQSGQEKILCWIHQLGYSEFHTGLGYQNLEKVLKEDKVFKYLNQASETGYPYDILLLRYNIGSDNGPTDKTLAQTVKEWNEKYISPKLVISTTTEAFRKFEEKYGAQIPAVSGDITGYWEDGGASSAKETSINRRNAARLAQAETITSLIAPKLYNEIEFREAWQKIMLYNEHTWGSWNSISEPESDFTIQQWLVKQKFASDGHTKSQQILTNILDTRKKAVNKNSVEVFNCLSWERSGLVYLNGISGFKSVLDGQGNTFPLQKLTDGSMVFIASNVPAFGSKIYTLSEDEVLMAEKTTFTENSMIFNDMKITIDKKSGAVKNLTLNGKNFVDTTKHNGINEYFYVHGRNPQNKSGVDQVTIKSKEEGPIISSLIIESDAPGCKSLSSEIQLIKPLGLIQIINVVDKEKIYEQEGLHFAFPLHIPNGQIRYNLAFSQVRAEYDQLPGSCKNYLTMENFVDISNHAFGMTIASIDAPLFEIGDITTDAIAYGWIEKLKPSQTIYSYVMNNYWETNYCASQEGKTSFTYVLRPHERFNASDAEKFAAGQMHGLLPIIGSDKAYVPDFELLDNGIIAIGLKPVNNGLLLKIYNAGAKPEKICWVKKPGFVFQSNFNGDKLFPLSDDMIVPSFGTTNLLLYKP
jgi:alpha-mannosidase